MGGAEPAAEDLALDGGPLAEVEGQDLQLPPQEAQVVLFQNGLFLKKV